MVKGAASMIKKSILVFIILSLIASALNYIVYPLFSRILAPGEYINITISLSLFTQISTFLSSILAITIGLAKSEHSDHANEKIELLQAFLFKLFLILAIFFLAFSPFIMELVHTPVLFAFPIALMMLFSIPIQIISGYLNGKNMMIKLGVVIVISASSQFAIGLATALLTKNGLVTMLSMVIAQIITLLIIYTVFSKDQLPGIRKSVKTSLKTIREKRIGSLVAYTTASSIAIMAVSLIQIADLFILQELQGTDMKFYADIYVISRVVFFLGMIFIWPFLGEISLDHHHINRKPFIKVVSYFAIITLASIAALYFFGDLLTHILFGANYDLALIREVGILSILYKFLLLIVTAVVLYFIVLRNNSAIWLSAALSCAILLFVQLLHPHTQMTNVLVYLNGLALASVIIGTILLLRVPVRKKA